MTLNLKKRILIITRAVYDMFENIFKDEKMKLLLKMV